MKKLSLIFVLVLDSFGILSAARADTFCGSVFTQNIFSPNRFTLIVKEPAGYRKPEKFVSLFFEAQSPTVQTFVSSLAKSGSLVCKPETAARPYVSVCVEGNLQSMIAEKIDCAPPPAPPRCDDYDCGGQLP